MRKHYFFDTSALVKLYHEEQGTDTFDNIIQSENPVIVISNIAIIEIVSAFLKKTRMQIIGHEVCDQAIKDRAN